jgi:hypothetical protein
MSARAFTIVCDVSGLPADAAAIDALARLQLTARRCGHELALAHASRDLERLLAFAGLAEVLRVESKRQAEEWEQRLGVEEERELDDPTV